MRYPVTFKTKEILDFTQTAGQTAWIPQVKGYILGATWTFQSDDTFTFLPSGARTDIYPLKGNFQHDGAKITFSGSSSAATGSTGTTSTVVDGSIDLSSSTPIMSMTWNTGSGSVAQINGQSFSGGSKSGYTMRIALK